MRRMFSLKQLQEIADSEVKSLVEGGTLSNAKPIYYHGLEMYKFSTDVIYGHILNNTSTPIDTYAKFLAWITSFESLVEFECSGILTIGGNQYDVLTIFKRANETSLNVIYKTNSGYSILDNVDLESNFTAINDGVNKIN